MLRRVQQIAGVLMALQGAGHSFLGTPMAFRGVTQEAVWFAGAGFAMIFLGLLNLAPTVTFPRWLRWAISSSNVLWLGLMVGLLSTSQSARVIAAVGIAICCTIGSYPGAMNSSRNS